MLLLLSLLFPPQDLIHGAPIGKPVASRAKVTAVYEDDDEIEILFTRMYVGGVSVRDERERDYYIAENFV